MKEVSQSNQATDAKLLTNIVTSLTKGGILIVVTIFRLIVAVFSIIIGILGLPFGI